MWNLSTPLGKTGEGPRILVQNWKRFQAQHFKQLYINPGLLKGVVTVAKTHTV